VGNTFNVYGHINLTNGTVVVNNSVEVYIDGSLATSSSDVNVSTEADWIQENSSGTDFDGEGIFLETSVLTVTEGEFNTADGRISTSIYTLIDMNSVVLNSGDITSWRISGTEAGIGSIKNLETCSGDTYEEIGSSDNESIASGVNGPFLVI